MRALSFFSLYLIPSGTLGIGVYLASNRKEELFYITLNKIALLLLTWLMAR
jgi:hypothetical protein